MTALSGCWRTTGSLLRPDLEPGRGDVARSAGAGRESLYKSLSTDGDPSLKAIANGGAATLNEGGGTEGACSIWTGDLHEGSVTMPDGAVIDIGRYSLAGA